MGFEYSKYFAEEVFTLEFYESLNYQSAYFDFPNKPEETKTKFDERVEDVTNALAIYFVCVGAIYMFWSYDPNSAPLTQEQLEYFHTFVLNEHTALANILANLDDGVDFK